MDHISRRVGTRVLVVSTMLATLLLTATPANAAAGSGGGTVEFTYDSQLGTGGTPCGKFNAMSYSSNLDPAHNVAVEQEDYHGTYTSGLETYAGPLQLDGSATETFYANPTGTYADEKCTMPTAVEVTATVTEDQARSTYMGGTVSCTFSGTFQRVGSNYTVTLSGTCSVNGGRSTPTTAVHDGETTTCGGGGPPDWCRGEETFVAAA
jgi:hypothetical protein